MGNSKSKAKKSTKPLAERYTLTNSVMNTYLLVMFTVFPLFVNLSLSAAFPFFFEQGYISIRHQKYYFLLAMTALTLVVELMLLVTRSSAEKKEADPQKRSLLDSLSFTDWAVLAFVLCCAVSTLFSPYTELAVFGEELDGGAGGRNNGLILMLTYAAIYFMVTRCFRFKEYVFTAMAAVGGAVYLLAVLNGFRIDPLRMFVIFENNENIYMNFMTTIGNKNMFASYICVTLPVIVTMFVHTDSLWRRAVYLAAAALGAAASVVCDSDSVVLGMGAFAAVFLVVYSRRPARLKRYLLALTVMLASLKVLRLFSALGGDDYKELSALPSKIMFSPVTFAVIGVLAVLTAALYFIDYKAASKRRAGAESYAKQAKESGEGPEGELILPRAVPFVIGGVIIASVCACIGIFVYFSFIDTKSELGEAERLLRYGDAWGTHRGFMWNKALEAFGGYSFFQKLFGAGPESFFNVFSPYFAELYDRFGDTSTDAAHNEYINYLLNLGILGLGSYLAFTGGALIRAFRAAKANPLALVFASAVVAYMAQATVNIALPIATPLFIIFVSLCETTARGRQISD